MAHNIYSLIILDRSGSMSSVRKETVDNVNETLGTIRAAARKHPGSKHYVSLLAFCGCTMQYIFELDEITKIKNITQADYEPCCTTPLHDAIGLACTRLHKVAAADHEANVSVTIITDGYENASKEWNNREIKKLIELYRSEGWLFTYIGADHDVEKVAMTLSINNTLVFEKTAQAMPAMSRRVCACRSSWLDDASERKCSEEDNAGFFSR